MRPTSRGTLPEACTASVWNRAPCRCVSSASSCTGWTVPITLLAVMIETRCVFERSAAASESGLTTPSAPTGR